MPASVTKSSPGGDGLSLKLTWSAPVYMADHSQVHIYDQSGGVVACTNADMGTGDADDVLTITWASPRQLPGQHWRNNIISGEEAILDANNADVTSYTTSFITAPALTVSEMRRIVRQSIRDEGNDSVKYPDRSIDLSALNIFSEIGMTLRYKKRVDSITLTTDSSAVDLSALVGLGLEPHRAIAAYLDSADATAPQRTANLEFPGFEAVRAHLIGRSSSGEPCEFAFEDPTTGAVFPKPSKAYVLKLRWNPPIAKWNPGTVIRATALATVQGGAVTAIGIVAPGGRYAPAPASVPTVSIIGDGSGATATATLDNNGQIASIAVTAGGSGYTCASVSISGGATDTPIDMDSDMLYRVLMFVGSVCQYNEPSQAFAQPAYTQLLSKIRSMAYVGTLGAQTAQRSRLP